MSEVVFSFFTTTANLIICNVHKGVSGLFATSSVLFPSSRRIATHRLRVSCAVRTFLVFVFPISNIQTSKTSRQPFLLILCIEKHFPWATLTFKVFPKFTFECGFLKQRRKHVCCRCEFPKFEMPHVTA